MVILADRDWKENGPRVLDLISREAFHQPFYPHRNVFHKSLLILGMASPGSKTRRMKCQSQNDPGKGCEVMVLVERGYRPSEVVHKHGFHDQLNDTHCHRR